MSIANISSGPRHSWRCSRAHEQSVKHGLIITSSSAVTSSTSVQPLGQQIVACAQKKKDCPCPKFSRKPAVSRGTFALSHITSQPAHPFGLCDSTFQYNAITSFALHQDKSLDSIGLRLLPVVGDGACLFRCFAHRIYGTEQRHLEG